ncbi:4Fe-4S binding protein, partial [Klebsiella aerogenes]|uniref:4Fe-4S binding protein n=1 Tax=Klebsiella aerogenes TaxID=548 RepID=UPI001953604E
QGLSSIAIAMGSVIITDKEKCRKCYCCVRSCPVKAIKVEKRYTEIIFDRCIGCGNCLSNLE